MKLRKDMLLILVSSIAFVVLLYNAVTIVPKKAATEATLTVLSRRIRLYVKLNYRIPPNLSNLPVLRGFSNGTEDAWGNDIIYLVHGTEVTLLSFGRDGKHGGQGDDADIIKTFDAFEKPPDDQRQASFPSNDN